MHKLFDYFHIFNADRLLKFRINRLYDFFWETCYHSRIRSKILLSFYFSIVFCNPEMFPFRINCRNRSKKWREIQPSLSLHPIPIVCKDSNSQFSRYKSGILSLYYDVLSIKRLYETLFNIFTKNLFNGML